MGRLYTRLGFYIKMKNVINRVKRSTLQCHSCFYFTTYTTQSTLESCNQHKIIIIYIVNSIHIYNTKFIFVFSLVFPNHLTIKGFHLNCIGGYSYSMTLYAIIVTYVSCEIFHPYIIVYITYNLRPNCRQFYRLMSICGNVSNKNVLANRLTDRILLLDPDISQ